MDDGLISQNVEIQAQSFYTSRHCWWSSLSAQRKSWVVLDDLMVQIHGWMPHRRQLQSRKDPVATNPGKAAYLTFAMIMRNCLFAIILRSINVTIQILKICIHLFQLFTSFDGVFSTKNICLSYSLQCILTYFSSLHSSPYAMPFPSSTPANPPPQIPPPQTPPSSPVKTSSPTASTAPAGTSSK